MAGPVHRGPREANPYFVVCLLLLPLPLSCVSEESPHAIKKLTWRILTQTGEEVWRVTANHAPYSWWPPLTPDFCQLAAGLASWDIPTIDQHQLNGTGGQMVQDCNHYPRSPKTWSSPCGTFHDNNPAVMTAPGCVSPTARCRLAQSDFYVCPKDGRSRATAARCGGFENFFCARWGCETTGAAYWNPTSSWDLISVTRGYSKPRTSSRFCYSSHNWKAQNHGLSLPLNITFTPLGRANREWPSGKTWGLRWYLSGVDKGVIFQILLTIENLNSTSIGPNLVLPDQKVPSSHEKVPSPHPHPSLNPTPSTVTTTIDSSNGTLLTSLGGTG